MSGRLIRTDVDATRASTKPSVPELGACGPFLPKASKLKSIQKPIIRKPLGSTPAKIQAQSNIVYLFRKSEKRESQEIENRFRPLSESLEIEESELVAPDRNYDCDNYSTCLGLAAALDWTTFSCRSCCGSVNQQLLWRAHQKVKDNETLRSVCNLPLLK